MNSGNASFLNPVREKEDLTASLVVVVTVLGTLLAVGVLGGGVWACVVCGRMLYRQKKWLKRRNFGQFPPQPREMVELGQLSSYSANNTGISKSLGLATSQPPEKLPALPAPKSWTPSPPFDYKEKHTPLDTHCTSCVHHRKKRARHRHLEAHPKRKRGLRNAYNTHGNTAAYHPGYNTMASDVWSVRSGTYCSSSSHTSSSGRPSLEERQTSRHCSGRRHEARCRQCEVHMKAEKSKSRRKVHTQVDLHSDRCNKWRFTVDRDTEPPDACSSHRGSPSSHHLPAHSLHQPRSCRAEGGKRCIDSRRKLAYNEPSKGHKDWAAKTTTHTTHRLNVKPETRRKREREEEEESSSTQNDTQTPPSSKSRRLWRESCGFRDEVVPLEAPSAHASGPCWIHHPHASVRQRQWRADPPSHPPPEPCQESAIGDEAREQEVFRRVAQKYGFCETCGCEGHKRSLMQQHKAACGGDRNERCGSFLADPTMPSMSWDNITPQPSPAVPDTPPPPQVAEGMNVAQSNEETNNEAGCGCGNLTSATETT